MTSDWHKLAPEQTAELDAFLIKNDLLSERYTIRHFNGIESDGLVLECDGCLMNRGDERPTCDLHLSDHQCRCIVPIEKFGWMFYKSFFRGS